MGPLCDGVDGAGTKQDKGDSLQSCHSFTDVQALELQSETFVNNDVRNSFRPAMDFCQVHSFVPSFPANCY